MDSSEVAELIEVWWLQIKVRFDVKKLNKQTNYAAFLVFKLDRPENLERVSASVTFGREITDSKDSRYFVFLDKERISGEEGRFPQRRDDSWMEINLGEFYNDLGNDGDLKICIWEKNTDNCKCGLFVRAIELRPVDCSSDA
ncbi:hypothetical protein ACJIZ3_013632 [Penstemon smallii]|uniref:Uncharacterized protein n=1 Tax=Penstemon smallii TaxID=265156 RepID=A0ABD3RH51_9LAMI